MARGWAWGSGPPGSPAAGHSMAEALGGVCTETADPSRCASDQMLRGVTVLFFFGSDQDELA